MEPRIASLQLFYDNEFVASVPLCAPVVTIGRSRGCDLRLIDLSVSRKHCRISLSEQGRLAVEDLSSTNGTLVNGRRVTSATLNETDVISVGRCSLVFASEDPASLQDDDRSWRRLFRRSLPVPLSPPRGRYVLASHEFITEFDAVSYAIVRDQSRAEDLPRTLRSHLKRLPRLQVLAGTDARSGDEPTRFSVSKNIFVGTDADPSLREPSGQVVLLQPEVRRRKWRLPWRTIEVLLIPLLLVVLGIFVGKHFLAFQIDAEFKKAEKSWDQRLAAVGETYRSVLGTPASRKAEETPLPVEEVWREIDRRPGLRNFVLFEILDEILADANLTWSLDQALQNLPRLRSVTARLPSVKQLAVVMSTESLPSIAPELVSKRLVFLSEGGSTGGAREEYVEYKTKLSASLAVVAGCAAVRKSAFPGNVVAAFTVDRRGKATAVFVNESRSTREADLWACIRSRLADARFDPPPGGTLSIVYTFRFAGPTRVEF